MLEGLFVCVRPKTFAWEGLSEFFLENFEFSVALNLDWWDAPGLFESIEALEYDLPQDVRLFY